MSLRLNVLANFGGQAVASVLAIGLAPWYVQLLGLEAWGLIGILSLLSAWLNVLDVGLTPTITRTLAALRAGQQDSARIVGELVRSIEVVYAAALLPAMAVVIAAAPLLALHWLKPGSLGVAETASALAWIALAVVLRLYENIYRAVLSGLERLVLLNALAVVFAVLRWGGGLVFLYALDAPRAADLFVWHAAAAGASLLVFALVARGLLQRRVGRQAVRFAALWRVRRFAGGIAVASTLGLLLGQIDKIVLSTLLPLAEFGVYVFAAALADALALLSGPLYAAMLPRFVALFAGGEQQALARLYLAATQALAAALVPCTLLLALHAQAVIEVWSGDAQLAARIAPLVALLALGRLLNASMQLPAALQVAAGWTRLGVLLNLVAVLVLLPLVLLSVPAGGAVAYAVCWLGLNVVYVAVGVTLTNRRLFPELAPRIHWAWLRDALLRPAAWALPPLLLLASVGLPPTRAGQAAALAATLLVALAASAWGQPAVRALLPRRGVRPASA